SVERPRPDATRQHSAFVLPTAADRDRLSSGDQAVAYALYAHVARLALLGLGCCCAAAGRIRTARLADCGRHTSGGASHTRTLCAHLGTTGGDIRALELRAPHWRGCWRRVFARDLAPTWARLGAASVRTRC